MNREIIDFIKVLGIATIFMLEDVRLTRMYDQQIAK